jgi:hypothetical protein
MLKNNKHYLNAQRGMKDLYRILYEEKWEALKKRLKAYNNKRLSIKLGSD